MKKTNPIFIAPLLQDFLTEGLIKEKNASAYTIESYTYSYQLLFEYSKKALKKNPQELTLNDLNANFIRSFLMHLEEERQIKPQSRNQRLAALKSFFKYILPKIPKMGVEISQILAIQDKREDKKLIHFLTQEEVKALLNCQDLDIWIGRRDHNLILFAVETGLRVSEIIRLTWKDISIAKHCAYVHCIGKGRKERDVILSREMTKHLKKWQKETGSLSIQSYIFPNVYGGSMSADTFQSLLKKYGRRAEKQCASLKNKKISPHVLRHTTAMNLRKAGVDLLTIGNILGHKSIVTTQIYLEVDTRLQEETLNLLTPNKMRMQRYKAPDDVKKFMKNLRCNKNNR